MDGLGELRGVVFGGDAASCRGRVRLANTGGVQLTGTLDALRGGLRALIVRPVAPVCLTGPAPADAVSATDAVQVYSDTDAVMTTMMSLMGREVQLTGRMYAPFAQLHRAPIVMEVVAVEIK